MPHTNSWDDTTPLGSQYASSIDNFMRAMKLDVHERMLITSIWGTSTSYDGYPRTLPFRGDDNTSLISTSAANSLTGSNAYSMVDLAQTWNTSGTPTAFKVNITDTVSNAASLLFDFQVGGVSKGKLSKAGVMTVPTLAATDITTATLTVSGATVFNGAVTFNSTVSTGIVTTSLTLSGDLSVGGNSTFAGTVDLAGGLIAGSGNVGIIDASGKIPAISSTYFTSLSGASLTGVGLLASANTWTAANRFAGIDEALNTSPFASNTLTLDLGAYSVFQFTLNATVTTMTISNIPSSGRYGAFTLRVVANGSSQVWSWFASTVVWTGGTVPTRTTTNGKIDVFYFHTVNGGTTWYGSTVGQNW